MTVSTFGPSRRILIAGASAAAIAGLASAAAPNLALAEDFDLNALIEAAKKEPPIHVYDSTGKIVGMAEEFTKKYGVQATGTKIKSSEILELVIREGQAGNVQGDVVLVTDLPATIAQVVPQNLVESWLPPDMQDKVPEVFQDPLVVATDSSVWTYNTEVFDSCPVKNIWELTEPEWKGKVAIYDPLLKTSYIDWFNQLASHGDDKMAEAYKAHFGKELQAEEDSATAHWVAALAANSPLLVDADEAVAEAVGAPGQTEPKFGLMSTAKYRDNADLGYKLGICKEMTPWVGWAVPKVGLIATGTKSPNAAKLFIHYVMTPEGIAPQAADGKLSTNADVKVPDDEPSGISSVMDKIFQFSSATALEDWDARQDWQDLWRVSYQK
jgi:iron(III) transport system substrate-binding protein